MKDGFIKVAASNAGISVADPLKNAAEIIKNIKEADEKGVNLLVFPELCITGSTCGDLFYNPMLLDGALLALKRIAHSTEDLYPAVVVGLPLSHQGKLFNCAAVIISGNILGIVPQIHVDKKQFTSGSELNSIAGIMVDGEEIPFGTELIFQHDELSEFSFGIEIGSDFDAPISPAVDVTAAGATMIAVPSANAELVGAVEYRRMMLQANSSRLNCGYIYSNAAADESTQDMVFSAHSLVAENGAIIDETLPFSNKLLVTEIDVQRLFTERQKNKKFACITDGYFVQLFSQPLKESVLTRRFEPNPFVSSDEKTMNKRAESILSVQAHGLKKRLSHTYAKRAVIGISGGLDSTLALLVAIRAMKLLDRPTTDILAVTMPCFGTSSRTKNNAITLCEALGVELKEVDITASVRRHFTDIGHDEKTLDVTFENAQARERTQVLMDIANQCGGIVIGTGDLSELALGWATYNGDHMSMYGVNASIPKTLVRYLVHYEALQSDDFMKATLLDILDTPVSPELLPVDKNGQLSQKTEDLVGPYELHDFYLYYFLRYGYKPQKLLRLARYVLGDKFDEDTMKHWLKTFIRRFFNQQFKRSCLPDGPKVGTVSLSPRGDWQMPSDATSALWLNEME